MTSPSPLERLAGTGNVLGKEAPGAKEFDGLVRSGRILEIVRETDIAVLIFVGPCRLPPGSHARIPEPAGRRAPEKPSCRPAADR
jgi:hypothetical protein